MRLTTVLYAHPTNGQQFPVIQIVTVEDLLHGRKQKLPPHDLPDYTATRRGGQADQLTLDLDDAIDGPDDNEIDDE